MYRILHPVFEIKLYYLSKIEVTRLQSFNM